jgi:hypothetical protein
MSHPPPAEVLHRTRRLTAVAASCLALQLFGNLYEQLVGSVGTLADPRPGELVGPLDPGSPVFYYLPWAPLGVLLTVVLAARLPRLGAPAPAVRQVRLAVGAVLVAVAVKAVLIGAVNPRFRDPGVDAGTLHDWALTWAVGNGVAIVAVAAALALVLTWRAALVDEALAAARGRRQEAAPVAG